MEQNNIEAINKITVSTANLCKLLDCGKPSAVSIGTKANAKICIGRKILWNINRIQNYLDEIAE